MAKITYIEFSGAEHVADVPKGSSVMEGAIKNMIPGIDADCGGACACATCHVYVDPAWTEKVGKPSSMVFLVRGGGTGLFRAHEKTTGVRAGRLG